MASCRIAFLFAGLTAPLPALADDATKIDIVSPQEFPDLAYTDDAGATHHLKTEKDTLTIVHFWATWCVPCVEELPQVDAIQAALASKGVKIIAISMDGDKNMPKVKKFLSEHTITHLTPYLDIGTDAFKAAKVQGMPTTIFLDGSGMKTGIAEGALDWKSKPVQEFIDLMLRAKH